MTSRTINGPADVIPKGAHPLSTTEREQALTAGSRLVRAWLDGADTRQRRTPHRQVSCPALDHQRQLILDHVLGCTCGFGRKQKLLRHTQGLFAWLDKRGLPVDSPNVIAWAGDGTTVPQRTTPKRTTPIGSSSPSGLWSSMAKPGSSRSTAGPRSRRFAGRSPKRPVTPFSKRSSPSSLLVAEGVDPNDQTPSENTVRLNTRNSSRLLKLVQRDLAAAGWPLRLRDPSEHMARAVYLRHGQLRQTHAGIERFAAARQGCAA